jgi:cobalt/nickel transport system permease protein
MSLRLDSYFPRETCLHRLDPRARLIFVVSLVAGTGALPPGWGPLAALLVAIFLAMASRAPLSYYYLRVSVIGPFILAMGAFRLLASVESSDAGLSLPPGAAMAALAVVCKAFAAAILLSMLVATSGIPQILWALEKLHAPNVVVLVSNLMFRYFDLLLDEWASMNRSRASRGGDRLRLSRFRVLGGEIGLLFVRSWERAERVHQAMISRGFTGNLPAGRPTSAPGGHGFPGNR